MHIRIDVLIIIYNNTYKITIGKYINFFIRLKYNTKYVL